MTFDALAVFKDVVNTHHEIMGYPPAFPSSEQEPQAEDATSAPTDAPGTAPDDSRTASASPVPAGRTPSCSVTYLNDRRKR